MSTGPGRFAAYPRSSEDEYFPAKEVVVSSSLTVDAALPACRKENGQHRYGYVLAHYGGVAHLGEQLLCKQ